MFTSHFVVDGSPSVSFNAHRSQADNRISADGSLGSCWRREGRDERSSARTFLSASPPERGEPCASLESATKLSRSAGFAAAAELALLPAGHGWISRERA